MSCIGGEREGGEVGGRGVWASRRLALPAIRAPTVALCPQQVTDMCTTRRMGRDEHCQQFDTTPTLISVPSGPTGPVMHQYGFTGSAKSCLSMQIWLCIAAQLMFLDSA